MKKESKRFKILLGVLFLLTIGLCIYFVCIVHKLNDVCDDIGVKNEFDFGELSKISKSDFNFIKMEGTTEYLIGVDIDGTIYIDFDKKITNITDAKDFELFYLENDIILYILTKSGYIYKYNLSNITSNKFNAEKIDEYSNIEQLLTYSTRKANAGGCDYVVLIDKNNKYYEIESLCR